MKNKLCVLALTTVSIGFAQVNFTNPDEASVVSFQTKEIDISSMKTEGSPYFQEEFKRGTVYMDGQKKIIGNLRYNAFNSEIELQRGDSEYTAILKRNNISVKIADETYVLIPYHDDVNGNLRTGYFVAMNQGKVSLLHKPEKKLRRGRAAATNYDRTVPPRYIDVSSYYIRKGDEPATKIYLRKKYFYEILGKEKIQDYVKKNNLRLNNVEDIITLLQYYNNQL
ncbi:hypothetical protein D2V93_15130 [Flagellimonas taeanensis]|uniref:hypothetical protein n=1 Tax=Flavobacteriaceae TaxID=49546 RepID=UPI000E69520C|nr:MULTISPECIES: hypothetical protein [Allomuricauda]MDC6384883.1 hypothetical protein [Muricauda sp. SK9]RIV49135.1 hypothetical protein D2V93_15130 [Allomuricauda taeanensis]